MAEVRWSNVARRELRAIIEYVAEDSAAATVTLRTRIDDAARRLLVFPLLGRMTSEFDDSSRRELIIGSYRLVYRVEADAIIVVTLIHGSRDLTRHLPDGPWDIE